MREEVFACDDYSTADWNSQTTTAAAGPLEDGEDLPGTFINPTVTFAVNISRKTKRFDILSVVRVFNCNVKTYDNSRDVDFNSQKYLLFTAYAIQERRQTEEKAWGVQSAAGGPDPRQVSTSYSNNNVKLILRS